MKRTMILSMAVATIIASPAAFADHHKGGDMEDKMHHKDHMMEKMGENSDDHMQHMMQKRGHMMEKMDADGDGVISKEEFIAAHEKKFKSMDADGDGTVTTDEMKAAWKAKREEWKGDDTEKSEDNDDDRDEMKDDM